MQPRLHMQLLNEPCWYVRRSPTPDVRFRSSLSDLSIERCSYEIQISRRTRINDRLFYFDLRLNRLFAESVNSAKQKSRENRLKLCKISINYHRIALAGKLRKVELRVIC